MMELTTEILEEFRDWGMLQTSSGEVEDFLVYLEDKTLARNARAARAYISDLREDVMNDGPDPSALAIEELLFAPPNDPDVAAWLGDETAKARLVVESNVGMADVINLAAKRIERGDLQVVDNGLDGPA